METTKPPTDLSDSFRKRDIPFSQTMTATGVLFGTDLRVSKTIINDLHPADVVIAYHCILKKKRIVPNNDQETIGDDTKHIKVCSVQKIDRAHKTLLDYLMQANPSAPSAPLVNDSVSSPMRRSQRKSAFYQSREALYDGAVLPTRLRFGIFLYYKGLISLKTLDSALQWQKNNRPLMGQIAMKNGFLTPRQFAEVLYALGQGEHFGSVAIDQKMLAETDISEILSIQRSYDLPLGRFFVDKGILSHSKVEKAYKDLVEHNSRYDA